MQTKEKTRSMHLGFLLLFLLGTSAGWAGGTVRAAPVGFESELTLERAVKLALQHHPDLRAHAWEVKAAEARAEQAGLLPNPELEIELENFAGSGELQGFDASESTLGLSQPIELGGKRTKRTRVARVEAELTSWDHEAKRLDVIAEVREAFFEALEAQERIALGEESLQVAEQTHFAVSERVKAGKVSPVEAAKAEVAVETVRLALQRARSRLESAYRTLSANWAVPSPTFRNLAGSLEAIEAVPPFADFENRAAQNPDLARWVTEIERRQALLQLEKAKGVPDLVLRGALHYTDETDDYGFVAGVSIPLPLFHRNQGSIRAADARLAQAKDLQEAAEIKNRVQQMEAYQRLKTARTTVKYLREKLLPVSQQAFEAVREGYRGGKFDYLDVLDAQRTLFKVKDQYLSSLVQHWKAWVAMERLTGQPQDLSVETFLSSKELDNEK